MTLIQQYKRAIAHAGGKLPSTLRDDGPEDMAIAKLDDALRRAKANG